MNTIRKILVPVDLSDIALHTVLYALEFAKHHQSNVEVFYSSDVPLVYGEGSNFGEGFGEENPAMMAEAFQLEDSETKSQLDAFKKRIQEHSKERNLSNVPVSYNFQYGSVVPSVNVEVESSNISLIICGIPDGGHTSKLIKRISEKLLRNAQIPVMAVPLQDQYTPIKNVAYTTDFNKHTIEEIERFLSFIKPFGAKTHCVHLGDMLNEQQEMDDILKPHFKDNAAVDFHLLTNATLNEGLQEFIKKHNIDALALHPNKTAIWSQLFGESHLDSILKDNNVPVISVH